MNGQAPAHASWTLGRLGPALTFSGGPKYGNPMAFPLPNSKKRHGLKAQMSSAIRKGRLQKFVSQEILWPWEGYSISNLVFLQKLANDERDWRHFVNF
jgi:hypothetical protein